MGKDGIVQGGAIPSCSVIPFEWYDITEQDVAFVFIEVPLSAAKYGATVYRPATL